MTLNTSMSTPTSLLDVFMERQDILETWGNDMIEEANKLTKSLQNELEVTRAEKNQLLAEMRREMYPVDQLLTRSRQQTTEKLVRLIVKQLAEIDKCEILMEARERIEREYDKLIEEITKWKPLVTDIEVPGLKESRERELETPKRGEDQIVVSSTGELQDEAVSEEDIRSIENEIADAIAEIENEHSVLQKFLTEQHQVLTEMRSSSPIVIPDDDIQRSSDNEVNIDNRGTPTELQKTVNDGNMLPVEMASTLSTKTRTDGTSSIQNSQSSATATSTIPNRKFKAKSSIMSKKKGTVWNIVSCPNEEGSIGEIDLPISESLVSTTRTERRPPTMKAKLNLYEIPGANQPAVHESRANETKPNPAFKPKVPSTLRSRIN